MALSEYYEDDDVVSQLRSFFDEDECWSIDFESLLSQIDDHDDESYSLKIKGRIFLIHKIHGAVIEVSE